MSALLDELIAVAAQAAEIIRAVYARPFHVTYKGPEDPVTDADRQANTLICARLAQAFPGVPIVAEESAPESFANFAAAERIFFVDPLDGTREFVDRNGEFAVMIGLVEAERATAGVVHAPELDLIWAGQLELGAFAIERNGQRTPLRVSETQTLEQAEVVSSRSHRSPRLEQALSRLGARSVRALGSAGLKGAEVARGAADAYVAPNYAGKRWDACASDALVSAAGGLFTDACGARFDYRSTDLGNDTGMLASNGLLHPAILARLVAPADKPRL